MNSVKHSLLLFNVAACSAVIGLLSVIIMVILSQRACPVAFFTMKHALAP